MNRHRESVPLKRAFAIFSVLIATAILGTGCSLIQTIPTESASETGGGSRSYSKLNDPARFLAGMPGGGALSSLTTPRWNSPSLPFRKNRSTLSPC